MERESERNGGREMGEEVERCSDEREEIDGQSRSGRQRDGENTTRTFIRKRE